MGGLLRRLRPGDEVRDPYQREDRQVALVVEVEGSSVTTDDGTETGGLTVYSQEGADRLELTTPVEEFNNERWTADNVVLETWRVQEGADTCDLERRSLRGAVERIG